ncbi:putative HTH-type transcriptional regulator YttP [compost metagenome]
MNSAAKKPSPPASSQGAESLEAQHADVDVRKQRSDGAEARARLLQAALRLFADKGFSKTSTREIALAADVNIAAIKYYFGDKAGLYRAVFTEPMGSPCDFMLLSAQDAFSLRESLTGFFAGFLEPLKQGDLVQLCVRLHFREMLEPTGLWAEDIDNNIKPAHAAMVAMLARHLNAPEADDEIHRLAFSIVSLPLQMFVARDVIDAIRPDLMNSPAAIDEWAAKMTLYAEAMTEVEASRRRALSGKTVSKNKS